MSEIKDRYSETEFNAAAKAYAEKHGIKITQESLENLPLSEDPKNKENEFTELIYIPTKKEDGGLTRVYYSKKEKVIREPNDIPFIPDIPVTMEEIEEVTTGYGILDIDAFIEFLNKPKKEVADELGIEIGPEPDEK